MTEKSRAKGTHGFADYRIKWQCLPYSESTWEDGELVNTWYSKEVEQFEIRQNNTNVPTRDCKVNNSQITNLKLQLIKNIKKFYFN